MTTTVSKLDTATLFTAPEDQIALVRDALESGHPGLIAHAIGVVARARGLSALERDTGKKRQLLDRAFKADGNPRLSTLMPVLSALNLQLSVEAAKPAAKRATKGVAVRPVKVAPERAA